MNGNVFNQGRLLTLSLIHIFKTRRKENVLAVLFSCIQTYCGKIYKLIKKAVDNVL